MKKRNIISNRSRPSNNSRRRLMLKRVHQRVLLRRQQFHQSEMFEQIPEVS